jgi:hypothetical protein
MERYTLLFSVYNYHDTSGKYVCQDYTKYEGKSWK